MQAVMVASNFGSGSFKKNMDHLENSLRNIADSYLHETIRKKEVLPTENQIDFGREMDLLFGELIAKVHQ